MVLTILKAKHSLVGRSLIPVIMEMKRSTDLSGDGQLARLKKDYPLEQYSTDEITSEFKKLTGENVSDILNLAGKQVDDESIRFCMHLAIVHANAAGAPKGQLLTEPQASGSRDASSNGQPSKSMSIEGRMKQLEETVTGMNKHNTEEALKNVRTLAGRPKLTSPGVLIAAMEVLVENATKSGHSELEYYSKALSACRQYEDHPDVCNLCLKLLGSSEDKKISSTIADWVKGSKAETVKKEKEEDSPKVQPNPLQQAFYPFPPFYPPQLMSAMPQGGPFMGGMMPPYPQFNGPWRQGQRQRNPRKNGACYYCKETGHLVNNCPKIKKD